MDNKIKTISIFGATGSVGLSAKDVILSNPDSYEVDTLVAKTNVYELIRVAILLKPKLVVIYDNKKFKILANALKNYDIEVSSGENDIISASKRKVDIFVAAIMGYAGLFTTYNSIPFAKIIALANKETMVCAGNIIMNRAKSYGCKIIPIDSEHNTLFQIIEETEFNYVKKLIITASGGPFIDFNKKELKNITPNQAKKHPIWNMGEKISIDSATMMNKGLELVEAAYLFNVSCSKIDILVHRQSIVHALIEFVDGFIKAGLHNPDMKIPLSYALNYPKKINNNVKNLDLSLISKLTFETLDESIFSAVKICRQAFESGSLSLIVLNAANEVAVDAFLKNQIKFDRIVSTVEEVLSKNFDNIKEDINNISELDKLARSVTLDLISEG